MITGALTEPRISCVFGSTEEMSRTVCFTAVFIHISRIRHEHWTWTIQNVRSHQPHPYTLDSVSFVIASTRQIWVIVNTFLKTFPLITYHHFTIAEKSYGTHACLMYTSAHVSSYKSHSNINLKTKNYTKTESSVVACK